MVCNNNSFGIFNFYNANWQIGDDAIIIKKTGSGIPFSIFDTIIPEGGRFFPLAYYAYNILLLFNDGFVSVHQHYMLVTIAFILFSYFIFKINNEILKEISQNIHIKNLLTLLFSFMIIQRSYTTFSVVFTTAWVDYFLLSAFIYYTFIFFKTQKTLYAIVAFFTVLYCTFSVEVIFILPLSFGILTILMGYDKFSLKENVFSYSLIFISLAFLTTYYLVVYRYTISAYDGSHGSVDTHFQNALKMLNGQKVLIIAIVVFTFRIFTILYKKAEINIIQDSLLLTGLAFTLGCFVLKLNWSMYYMISVIFVSFPVFYYCVKLLNIKYSLIIISLISLFYIRNFPKNIDTIQQSRVETKVFIDNLKLYRLNNYNFIWHDVLITENNWDRIMSEWKKESLSTLLKNEFKEKDFEFESEKSSEKNLLFFPKEYRNTIVTSADSLYIISNSGIIVTTNK